jgi:hypothetical protein
VLLAGSVGQQDRASPGQITQPADRRWWREARPHQPVRDEVADLLRVAHVSLAARDRAHVSSVEQPAVEVASSSWVATTGRPKAISHEAIYQSPFIESRGAIKRERGACLRTGRALRVPRARSKRKGMD